MARLLYSFDLKIGLSAHSSIASVYSETALSNCRDLHDASASSFAFLTVRIFLRVANAFLLSGSPLMAWRKCFIESSKFPIWYKHLALTMSRSLVRSDVPEFAAALLMSAPVAAYASSDLPTAHSASARTSFASCQFGQTASAASTCARHCRASVLLFPPDASNFDRSSFARSYRREAFSASVFSLRAAALEGSLIRPAVKVLAAASTRPRRTSARALRK
mmetsp:Transcript_11035/g.24331  ORF Transcript_11035/g.24331 Transcript_11035/m.24331 type:complete len:220 (-) Transcript_11035:589-1248(-)